MVALSGLTMKEVKQVDIEGYGMAACESRVEGGSKRAIKVGSDGKVNGSGMQRCVWIDCKRQRRMMARGGAAELGGIEIGRWHGVRREGRECGMQ